jgi:hypothetical protein
LELQLEEKYHFAPKKHRPPHRLFPVSWIWIMNFPTLWTFPPRLDCRHVATLFLFPIVFAKFSYCPIILVLLLLLRIGIAHCVPSTATILWSIVRSRSEF